MSKERDPRVQAIAEKLAEAQPYGGAEPSGFDFRKKPPSAADYHAARIAVKTLDEMAEYEYAMEISRYGIKLHILNSDWTTLEGAEEQFTRYTTAWRDNGNDEFYSAKIVKRAKAGHVSDA